MKRIFKYLFILFVFFSKAQQTTNYVQYIFNKAGVDPAASGTNINQKLTFVAGANRQWIAMDNAPKQTFVNVSYTIRPPRSYSYWQNVGAYIENDQSGIFTNTNYYVSYTIHLLLRKNLIASFGTFAGFRKFSISSGILDPNDPVLQKSNYQTYVYPDFIPGFRLSNKKFFFDISAKQITANKVADFSGNQIGGPSKLNPTFYISYGKVFPLSDYFTFLPSISLNQAIIGVPSFNTNLLFYYSNRMGFGLATRNLNFIGAIFQVRLFENLSVGLSYSYSLSKISTVAPNSYEIMVGIVPMGLGGKYRAGRSVAKCPALDF